MTVEGTVELEPKQFKNYILQAKKHYEDNGSYVHCIVLPGEMELMVAKAFMQGKLNGFITHNTDRKGKLREYLDGTKVMYTDKLSLGRGWFVLDSKQAAVPSDVVMPPTGPGSDPGGGTPIAALSMAA